ncbi:hypothetical protein CDCA_CDCA05G1540 [Cyanidium caldarium]|uniref:Uncharacterized protein n=1 Tax=Cyanidium caldarium TaxID=2771 RepID=A0AAV9ITS8_CYACA|nr:hypothetical protein CDCA_CDCA05G1540 [Cyanidium caldarium]
MLPSNERCGCCCRWWWWWCPGDPRRMHRQCVSVLGLLLLLLLVTFCRFPWVDARVYDQCDSSHPVTFPQSFPLNYTSTMSNYTVAADGSWAALSLVDSSGGTPRRHAFVRCGFNSSDVSDFHERDYFQVHAVPPRGVALTDTLQAGYILYGVVQPYSVRAVLTPEDLTDELYVQLVNASYIVGWQCNASVPSDLCDARYARGCAPSISEFTHPGAYACSGNYGNLTQLFRLFNGSMPIDVLIVTDTVNNWTRLVVNGTLNTTALNVSVLGIGEAQEKSALGRAEYVKLFGLLYGLAPYTIRQFNDIAESYAEAAALAATARTQPSVFYGTGYGDSFYFGSTYQASFITDANAYYVFGDHGEPLPSPLQALQEDVQQDNPLSLTSADAGRMLALAGANTSRFWLGFSVTTPPETTVAQVLQNYSYAADWAAVLCDNLYDYTKHSDPNPIFEQGVLRPDWVLKDHIRIFHPHLLPNYTFHYYRRMQGNATRCPLATAVSRHRRGTHARLVYGVQHVVRVVLDAALGVVQREVAQLTGTSVADVYVYFPSRGNQASNAPAPPGPSSVQRLAAGAPGLAGPTVLLAVEVYSPNFTDIASALSDSAATVQRALRAQGGYLQNVTVAVAARGSQSYVSGSPSASSSGLSGGGIAGIVLGTFFGTLLLATALFFLVVEVRYRKRRQALIEGA